MFCTCKPFAKTIPRSFSTWLVTGGVEGWHNHSLPNHYNDVNGVWNHQPQDCLRTHQISAPLAFVRGIHRWLVNSPHKGPVKRKIFSFDDVIMIPNHCGKLQYHQWRQSWYYVYAIIYCDLPVPIGVASLTSDHSCAPPMQARWIRENYTHPMNLTRIVITKKNKTKRNKTMSHGNSFLWQISLFTSRPVAKSLGVSTSRD